MYVEMKNKNFKDIRLPKFEIDSKAEAGLRKKARRMTKELKTHKIADGMTLKEKLELRRRKSKV